jgi:ABC-2 type transport system ATP-binding protein
MIQTEDLTKLFDDFMAVAEVNLKVDAGEVLVLLGPNGAGKTTTVRMLTSILRPSRGHANVAGYDVVLQPDKVRSSVGVLTEHHGLYGRMNAEEYLNFFGSLYGMRGKALHDRANQLLDKFGLGFALKKRLGEYSKGMRQKLALVRALLHDPPVLLLDEPTSAMDPESARMVRDALQSLRSENRTILLCTHNLVEAEELADQIAIIRKGKIIYNETPELLKRKLLGPVEFEARFANSLDGKRASLPGGVQLTNQGANWMRFSIEHPEIKNPVLIRDLFSQIGELITFQEVPRSLEKAYLEAVNRNNGDSPHALG